MKKNHDLCTTIITTRHMEPTIISAFFIGISTAFFTIFAVHILCYRKDRTHYQTVLGWVMAVWAVFSLKDLMLTFPQMYNTQILDKVMMVDGWSALTYTILLFEIIMPRWTTWRRLLLLAIPFILFTTLYALWTTKWVVYAYATFLWFYAWSIIFIGYIKARRRIKYVRENFSNIDHIDVSWLRPVFCFMIVTQLLWLYTSLFPNEWTDILYYSACLGAWLLVLHYSWNFQPIEEISSTPATDEDMQPDPSGKQYPFAERLEKLMLTQRLYLNKELTLDDLAMAVGTNRLYVSNYLNQTKRKTFYDYINQLRIEQVSLPLMKEHPELTLEHIAYESGFNSISTFRRAFVKLTGKTPSNFEKL
ncbi:MAG: helix-turn-helix transcriptional regulator [Bacteroidaceae bacterium]|nr:helix-turn-helix transcriptional regulator [Bacteroidaceae bacterium]